MPHRSVCPCNAFNIFSMALHFSFQASEVSETASEFSLISSFGFAQPLLAIMRGSLNIFYVLFVLRCWYLQCQWSHAFCYNNFYSCLIQRKLLLKKTWCWMVEALVSFSNFYKEIPIILRLHCEHYTTHHDSLPWKLIQSFHVYVLQWVYVFDKPLSPARAKVLAKDSDQYFILWLARRLF